MTTSPSSRTSLHRRHWSNWVVLSVWAIVGRVQAAEIAPLVMVDGAIDTAAILTINPESSRFVVTSTIPGLAADRPADAPVPIDEAAVVGHREIELPTARLKRWGRPSPRPVGPQALLHDENATEPSVVVGRLDAFGDGGFLLSGGDVGPLRLPSGIVDRWVKTASVATRPMPRAGSAGVGPSLLLANGDVVLTDTLVVDGQVATAWLSPSAGAVSGNGLPGSVVDEASAARRFICPMERVQAILPANQRPSIRGDPSFPRIVVVLADGSRIPIVQLAIERLSIANGKSAGRTATLLPAWEVVDEGFVDRDDSLPPPSMLRCDAGAIAAVEFFEPLATNGKHPDTRDE